METRNIHDYLGNVIGQLTLADDTSERDWSLALAAYAQPPKAIKDIIVDKIVGYKEAAKALIDNLKADNTLAGITAAQSAQMFADYGDILLMLREGAFPSAIYALQQKSPVGFVTQQMQDSWIAQIKASL